MPKLKVIGFDADDTLWHNETYYRLTEERFTSLLSDYADPDHLTERLLEAERVNIAYYGYGIKGFTLSMIQTALEVTENRVPQETIAAILDAGRELLRHPMELLPHAAEALEHVAGRYHVVLITKGDMLDQERKLAQSGLGDHFDAVEIVSEKTPDTYTRIFGAWVDSAMMIGNSVKSDVIPAIEAGAYGIQVPHGLEWELEKAERPVHSPKFHTIADLSALPDLIDKVESE